MGKNFNPVDAHRKAQRAKELKKNKDARKDKRENQLVHKDTREIENEIKSLKSEGKLNDALKARLGELDRELKHINTLKEKYVKDHPEEKDQVYRPRGGQRRQQQGEDGEDGEPGSRAGPSRGGGQDGDPMGHLYDKRTGKMRDPKRSVYYDPTYNPFGAPPPGMPYRERSQKDSDDEDDEDDSDDDIVMPEGPRPGGDNGDDGSESGSDSDDSDDIPLPAGPPPSRLPPPGSMPTPGFVPYTGMARPMQARPVPLSGFRPPPGQYRPPPPHGAGLPPRPPAAGAGVVSAGPSHPLPPRPPASGPASTSGIISAQPSMSSPAPAQPSTSTSTSTSTMAGGTISAEPQMRDLRKEATAFVPRGIKRKKGTTSINAAPGGGEVDEQGDTVRVRREDGPNLLGKLQNVLGDPTRTNGSSKTAGPISGTAAGRGTGTAGGTGGSGGDDEYQNFLKGLGDLA